MDDVRNEIASHTGSKDTHRISRVLEVMMAGALSLGASDIHLEPEEESVRMRYRLDGVLVEITRTHHIKSSCLKGLGDETCIICRRLERTRLITGVANYKRDTLFLGLSSGHSNKGQRT